MKTINYDEISTIYDNEAATALYKTCGFEPWYEFDEYSKSVSL